MVFDYLRSKNKITRIQMHIDRMNHVLADDAYADNNVIDYVVRSQIRNIEHIAAHEALHPDEA